MSERVGSRQHITRLVGSRALVVLGLSGVAVAQPMLDLFGRNAEFFVAGHYRPSQIVLFALTVSLLPPFIAIVAIAAGAAIHRRAGDVAFAVFSALFAAAFALAVQRTVGLDATPVLLGLALLFAAGATALLWRVHAVRMFASYLAAANLLFVGIFVFASDTSELILRNDGGSAAGASMGGFEGPVVVIVLDELPVTTIMRADGTVNEDRYPGFGELAEVSTWYRNASSPYDQTAKAVPALLTGTVGDPDAPGTYRAFPQNLFSLLGESLPIERYEPATDMCPPDTCDPMPPEPVGQALADGLIVYGHRVLPGSLRDDLPSIDDAWGGFGLDVGGGGQRPHDSSDDPGPRDPEVREHDAPGKDRPVGERAALVEQIDKIGPEPALHFTHVIFPHTPWEMSPTGAMDLISRHEMWSWFTLSSPDEHGYDHRRRFFNQLHSMQVGAADAVLQELLATLKSLPNWDDVLLVVTADHGLSFASDQLGRWEEDEGNEEQTLRVPLFIKHAGQESAGVDDRTASTMDVLPSIVDLLDIDTGDEWQFDGSSLYDDRRVSTEVAVSPDVDEALDIAARRAEWFHDDDWQGLAAIGDHGRLVGRELDDLALGSPTAYTATIDGAAAFADLPTDDGQLPLSVSGTVDVEGGAPPDELLVAVNGEIAGVAGTYGDGTDELPFIAYVYEGAYREGANDVELYEVEGERRVPAAAVTLHPVPLG